MNTINKTSVRCSWLYTRTFLASDLLDCTDCELVLQTKMQKCKTKRTEGETNRYRPGSHKHWQKPHLLIAYFLHVSFKYQSGKNKKFSANDSRGQWLAPYLGSTIKIVSREIIKTERKGKIKIG